MKQQLVLASTSPRRKELLNQIGVSYLVHEVTTDETIQAKEDPVEYVVRVASNKSKACSLERGCFLPILAADTCVVVNSQILGKPENEEHAKFMLNQLSGKSHIVYSAVSLRAFNELGECSHSQVLSMTEVEFRKIRQHEIESYWKTGEPKDKSGAYAIQGLASIFVKSIKGSFSGVVGLPLFETAELLSKQGIRVIA